MSYTGPVTGDPSTPNPPGLGKPTVTCQGSGGGGGIGTADGIAISSGLVSQNPSDTPPGSDEYCAHGCEGPRSVTRVVYGFPLGGGTDGPQCCGTDGSGGGGSQCCQGDGGGAGGGDGNGSGGGSGTP